MINIVELRNEHIIGDDIRPWWKHKSKMRQEIKEWLETEEINYFIIWQHPPRIVFYTIQDLTLFKLRWG